jgi:hypothetical protein
MGYGRREQGGGGGQTDNMHGCDTVVDSYVDSYVDSLCHALATTQCHSCLPAHTPAKECGA